MSDVTVKEGLELTKAELVLAKSKLFELNTLLTNSLSTVEIQKLIGKVNIQSIFSKLSNSSSYVNNALNLLGFGNK